MDYQNDPALRRRAIEESDRRIQRMAEQPISVAPVALGIAVLLGLGYLVVTTNWNSTPNPVTGSGQTEAPASAPTTTAPQQ
jgi:hypothetical protein